MRLLPLFIFWFLWFLNFSTRSTFSPILPLIEDTLSHGEAGGLIADHFSFQAGIFLVGVLTTLSSGVVRFLGGKAGGEMELGPSGKPVSI